MSHVAAFVRALVLLTLIAFAERTLFAFHHSHLSADVSLWQAAGALFAGVRFDLAVAAMLTAAAYLPAYLLARLSGNFSNWFRRLLYLALAILVLVHGADLLYFGETGRHLGYELKEAYNSRGELLGLALHTYPWSVLAQLVLLGFAGAVLYRVVPRPDPRQRRMFAPEKQWYHHFAPEAQLVLLVVASALLIRGGLQAVPLEPLHAQTIGDPKRAALALNGAYNALFSSLTPYSVERVVSATPNDEQKALVRALYSAAPVAALPAAEHDQTPPPNVVFLFLESWSAAYMGSYGDGVQATPFFDELRTRSLTTRDMLAGGHRTTEGLFATLCSAQNPLGATVAQSQLQNYSYACLPKILRGAGYSTAFFQGTLSGTSGTGAFAQSLGFEQSFGLEHATHPRLPRNTWGLHDPDEYEFALEKIGGLPQPFFLGLNTTSTHDRMLPPEAPTPFDAATAEGRYRNVLHFADGALREFVNALFTRYPNTVLVAVSDHAGPGKEAIIDTYRVPFLIYAPGRVTPTMVDGAASQRDIAPTVQQILGTPASPWFTGRSLLESRPLAADYYHEGVLGWIEGDTAVELPLRQPEMLRCFTARGDFAPLTCGPQEHEQVKRGVALTTVLQELLFRGQLDEFRAYRSPAEPPPSPVLAPTGRI